MTDVPGPTGGFIPPYITERLRILERSCPVCQAKPMEPCTVATNTGRRPVRWFHLDREIEPEAQEDC